MMVGITEKRRQGAWFWVVFRCFSVTAKIIAVNHAQETEFAMFQDPWWSELFLSKGYLLKQMYGYIDRHYRSNETSLFNDPFHPRWYCGCDCCCYWAATRFDLWCLWSYWFISSQYHPVCALICYPNFLVGWYPLLPTMNIHWWLIILTIPLEIAWNSPIHWFHTGIF